MPNQHDRLHYDEMYNKSDREITKMINEGIEYLADVPEYKEKCKDFRSELKKAKGNKSGEFRKEALIGLLKSVDYTKTNLDNSAAFGLGKQQALLRTASGVVNKSSSEQPRPSSGRKFSR